MFEIIKLLFDVCLFKKRPQDLPYSLFLLRLLAAVNLISSFLILNIQSHWLNAILQSIVGILLVAGFSWIALYSCRRLSRFYQTTAALLGTDALIGFFALPAMASMMIGQGGLLAFLVMLGLIGWHWLIISHIIRNALELSISISLGLAFLYLIASYQIMGLLFPDVK